MSEEQNKMVGAESRWVNGHQEAEIHINKKMGFELTETVKEQVCSGIGACGCWNAREWKMEPQQAEFTWMPAEDEASAPQRD